MLNYMEFYHLLNRGVDKRNIFLDEKDGAFILAQWKVLAQTFSITEKTDGKKLCAALRKLAVTDNSALVEQIIDLENSRLYENWN